MATRERPRARPDDDASSDELAYEAAFGLDDEITDEDIELFMAEQDVEAEEQTRKPGFWNLQTGSGLALITIGTLYLLQRIGAFPIGLDLGALAALLPWLAGILIILTGFGVLSWSPSRKRAKARQKAREKARERARKAAATASRTASGRATVAREADRARRAADAAFERVWSKASTGQRKRRLTKSRTQRKVAGVAGGIAAYLGIEPTLVRIAFVLGAIFGSGVTIPLYLVLAFVLPNDDADADDAPDAWVRVVRD